MMLGRKPRSRALRLRSGSGARRNTWLSGVAIRRACASKRRANSAAHSASTGGSARTANGVATSLRRLPPLRLYCRSPVCCRGRGSRHPEVLLQGHTLPRGRPGVATTGTIPYVIPMTNVELKSLKIDAWGPGGRRSAAFVNVSKEPARSYQTQSCDPRKTSAIRLQRYPMQYLPY